MKNIIVMIICILLGGCLFLILSVPNNIVNFIPYLIYEKLSLRIITEDLFILFFDCFLSILVIIFLFKIIKRNMK